MCFYSIRTSQNRPVSQKQSGWAHCPQSTMARWWITGQLRFLPWTILTFWFKKKTGGKGSLLLQWLENLFFLLWRPQPPVTRGPSALRPYRAALLAPSWWPGRVFVAARGVSRCSEQGLLSAAASLGSTCSGAPAPQELQREGSVLGAPGSRAPAPLLLGMWDPPRWGIKPVSWRGGWILYPWAPREAPATLCLLFACSVWWLLAFCSCPFDCKEIQPVRPKGNQAWVFIGRTDA